MGDLYLYVSHNRHDSDRQMRPYILQVKGKILLVQTLTDLEVISGLRPPD